jgi:hypothetical protein
MNVHMNVLYALGFFEFIINLNNNLLVKALIFALEKKFSLICYLVSLLKLSDDLI